MGQREPAALEGAIAVAPLAEQSLAFRELVLGSAGPFAEQLACDIWECCKNVIMFIDSIYL
jgi:hypothetical protein